MLKSHKKTACVHGDMRSCLAHVKLWRAYVLGSIAIMWSCFDDDKGLRPRVIIR